MVQVSDSLELLLPGAGEDVLRRARSVVQFLRLLANDAASIRAGAVVRRIMVPAAPARLQLHRLHRAGLENLAIAERICIAVPELVELASGADTCSLLLTVRLTAAARAEDSWRYRNRQGWLVDAA